MFRRVAPALFLAITSAAIGQTLPQSFKAGAEPACDATRRGMTIVRMGGAGEPDLLQTCLRDGAGRFLWVNSSQQNPNSFAGVRSFGGCPMFPANNIWNTRVDGLPLSSDSAGIITTYAEGKLGSVPDFVLNLANAKTPSFPLTFFSAESDGGKYPITPDMQVEGFKGPTGSFPVSGGPYEGDAHLIVLRTDQCKLYEIFGLKTTKPPYNAYSGAIYDLLSNDLRPDGWTSADAAGLPIWPGILTYAELYGADEIRHMLRFTVDKTRRTAVWPARHYASRSNDAALPPMGSRWRLKSSFDEATCKEEENAGKPFPPEMQRLIRALKRYGMILADNGLSIKLTTDSDHRWGDPSSPTSPNWIFNGWQHCISGKDFEVVNTAPLMVNGNSGEAAR